MEGAADLEPDQLGADGGRLVGDAVDTVGGAGDHGLAGGVDVGDPELETVGPYPFGQSAHLVQGRGDEDAHGALAGLGGLAHGPAPGGDEYGRLGHGERAGGDQGGVLAQAVPRAGGHRAAEHVAAHRLGMGDHGEAEHGELGQVGTAQPIARGVQQKFLDVLSGHLGDVLGQFPGRGVPPGFPHALFL